MCVLFHVIIIFWFMHFFQYRGEQLVMLILNCNVFFVIVIDKLMKILQKYKGLLYHLAKMTSSAVSKT